MQQIKFQISSTKFQITSKNQYSNLKQNPISPIDSHQFCNAFHLFRIQDFNYCDLFVICNLLFVIFLIKKWFRQRIFKNAPLSLFTHHRFYHTGFLWIDSFSCPTFVGEHRLQQTNRYDIDRCTGLYGSCPLYGSAIYQASLSYRYLFRVSRHAL